MNIKRFFFWLVFIVILALIIWGLIAAINKGPKSSKGPSPAPVSATDHILGSSTAVVTLVEYSDFQCPACELYYPLISRLYNEASSTLRLVYRHFPLSQHANAMPASLASEAAAQQGKFWQMYDQLFSGHTDWTELSDPAPVFLGYAVKIGLDPEKFKTDLASSSLKSFINSQQDEGIHIGINQTPTFFVNGQLIDNPKNYEEFKALIDAAARGGTR